MSALHVMVNEKQLGPLADEVIRAMVKSGEITAQTLCWSEGMASWQPLSQVRPALCGSAAPPPQPHPAPSGRADFEVLLKEVYRMPKITLESSEVTVESGALHYMTGNIEIESKLPSMGGIIKSKLTKERAVRPIYRGTGEIYLEPTFGECNIKELKGETWILDKGAFLASDTTVDVGMITNKSWAGLFGGEGFFQTSVSGHGKVLFHSQGPLEEVHLKNDTLKVDGAFAVARTEGLEFKVEKATGKLFSSWTSGEGFVNTFRGTGTVLIAPVPNRFLTMLREFGGLRWAISRIKGS